MIFAHGLGSRGQLPLPVWMFTWAAAIALVVSFVALGVLWTRPLLDRLAAGRSLAPPTGAVGAVRGAGQAIALALYLLCLVAGLAGADVTSDNILPVTIYVVVWVGALLVSGVVGDLWGAVNPIATVARGVEAVARRAGRQPGEAPTWLGQWPAALGLMVFLFYELGHPSGAEPRTLGYLLAVHLAISVAAAAAWGADWVAEHEPFSALFAWVGAMGPIFRRPEGGLGLRPPVSGLARMPVVTGTAVSLLVVLGGTTYDGFSESEVARQLLGRPTGWSGAVTALLGLVGSIVVIGLLYAVGIWWTSRVTGMVPGRAASAFAPSLAPIVFGYAVAHYFQLLVDESQSFVFRLSDPFGRGWDLFGGSDGLINFNLISVDLIAWLQVIAILVGHIGAVVVAHDRSIELFDVGHSLRSQFAMLLVMVAYSTLGLWLLLNA
ncbi:MAG: hypothetical protein OEY70_07720 [Acidimicrobiia bacterium]|nr:hypothetical protein [Acidimicrobiia bacterium]